MKALVVCAGAIPAKEDLDKILAPDTQLIAVDGAANRILEYGIDLDLVIGDFDSISPATLETLQKKNVEAICLASQYRCDLEKALDHCVQKGIMDVVIVGLFGGRADYNLANAVILFQYLSSLNIVVLEPHFKLYAMKGTRSFSCLPQQLMSFVPWGVCRGVTLKDVRYTLQEMDFKPGEMGVSNVALKDFFTVSIREGYAWVFVGDSVHAFASF